jgi:FAD/FMN-containing dehydrogenase
MGLTGTVLDATFRMMRIESGWIRQQTLVARNLAEALELLGAPNPLPYSVAWIDCLSRGSSLGRSLVYLGDHAGLAYLEDLGRGADRWPTVRGGHFSIPVDAPRFTLNRHVVSAFNEIYFRSGASQAGAERLVRWDGYFFPLDHVQHWNRLYGRQGFIQHQCVIPSASAEPVLHEILDRIASRGSASFLAVLKKLGPGSGWLSFPADGYTLALDLKFHPDLLGFLDEIDRLVVDAGGRLYLAKDARQSRQTFDAGYAAADRFRQLRRALGATARFESFQARRLGL